MPNLVMISVLCLLVALGATLVCGEYRQIAVFLSIYLSSLIMMRFLFLQSWVYLGFVARICLSMRNPSICLLKLSSIGIVYCSISSQGTILKGSLLCIGALRHMSLIWQFDTVMTGCSLCTPLSFSCLRCQNCSSDGNSTSSV